MNIIALDDEPLALRIIEKFVNEIPEIELLATFTDATKAADFLQNNTIDLLLTDINMPDINGLKFVSDLTNERPMVIFITAYKEHAHEGFDLGVIDYLIKPISKDRFQKAIQKALNLKKLHLKAALQNSPELLEYFFIFVDYQQVKIIIKEILYIESMGDYVKIHLNGQSRPILTLERIKNLTEQLLPHGFKRIHRSFLINSEKVEALQKSQVRIGEVWLPIGESFK
jgi:two-component system, LytTR family, response regulator